MDRTFCPQNQENTSSRKSNTQAEANAQIIAAMIETTPWRTNVVTPDMVRIRQNRDELLWLCTADTGEDAGQDPRQGVTQHHSSNATAQQRRKAGRGLCLGA
jgi:hypothetical protein